MNSVGLPDIVNVSVSDCDGFFPCNHLCRISFSNDKLVSKLLSGPDVLLLLNCSKENSKDNLEHFKKYEAQIAQGCSQDELLLKIFSAAIW